MEEALIALLIGNGWVGALVGDRVWPHSRPQGSRLPALTVMRISGGPGYADDGEIGIEQARLQIDCWAKTYTEAKTIARAVRGALSAFASTSGSVQFRFAELDAERDERDGGSNTAEYLFRVSQDWLIWSDS